MKKRIISFVLVACMACALLVPGASALDLQNISIYPPVTEDFVPETVKLLPADVCAELCENPALFSIDEDSEATPYFTIVCNNCQNRIGNAYFIGSHDGGYLFTSTTCFYRYYQFEAKCSCGWSTIIEDSSPMPHVWGSYDSGGTRYCDNCQMGSH